MNQPIAYLVSRFPKLTETFILYEMQALEALGARIELFPLIRHKEEVIHPEAHNWIKRARYRKWYSPRALFSQLYWLWRSPSVVLGIWFEILSEYRSKPRYLLRYLLTTYLAFDFAREMQKIGIGHIHAHWATYPTTAAYIVSRLTGIPYSLTAHAHDIYVDQTMLEKKINAAAFTITISEHNRQYLQQHIGIKAPDRIQVLHCGVDTKVFKPSERSLKGLFTIIAIAALEEKKGHRYLIEALQSFSTRGWPFRCLLIGEGPQRSSIEAQIHQAGLQDRVTLMGGQSRSRVIELLGNADVMVLPSIRLESGKQEGIPVALMEGMAMGLPVIASRISGVPELVIDGVNGVLVPEKDAQALTSALIELYQDADYRRELGSRAREKVLTEFDLARTTASLYSLIKQDRGGSKPSRPIDATTTNNRVLEV